MYQIVSQRLCNEDIAGSFCEQVIIPLKRVRASCVSLVSISPQWECLAITLSIHNYIHVHCTCTVRDLVIACTVI